MTISLTTQDVFAELQPATFHVDVSKADGLELQLEQLRQMWSKTERYSKERDVIENVAYGVEQQLLHASFRETRYEDECWIEPNVIAKIDSGYEDAQLMKQSSSSSSLPQSDAEWLSWKVNKFIKNISYRSKKGQLYLRAGRKSIALSGNGQFIEFTCYGCRHFHGKHYVGGSRRMTEVILSRVLAHTYRH